MNNLLLTPYAIDVFSPVAKWLAIGVVSLIIVVSLLVYFFKRDVFAKTLKILLFSAFIFLLLLGLTCLGMEISKSFSQSYAQENWLDRQAILKYILIPIASLLLIILGSFIATFITAKKSSPDNAKKNLTLSLKICGTICLVALIVCGALLAVFYNDKYIADGYFNSDTASVNQSVLYIMAALIVIVIISLAFLLDKDSRPIDTRCISLAGITIAMSFGLSYVRLFKMAQGGSITLFSLLPIMIFSYVYGTKKGVLICFIYGILQAVQDPWIIHPAQFLLDYPIAFSGVGLTGMFANARGIKNYPQVALLVGGIVAGCIRFISHVLSGVFAFAAYADGLNPWIYSLGYNSFVFIDLAITLVVGVLVFSSKAFIKEVKRLY